MKTKSFLVALAAVALVFVLTPSEAQAGGRRYGCSNYGYSNYGYSNYYGRCYAPVVVRRPVRVAYAPAVYVRTPVISIGFGFGGGGRCRY